jgi:hypothetical protein
MLNKLTMSTTLQEYVNNKNGSNDYKFLPLCHTSKYSRCQTIAESSKLTKRHCDVYKEDLLYFFYGKSRYNVNRSNLDCIIEIDEMPVTFLFVFKKVLEEVRLKRYLPFDSGGFDRYGLTNKEHFTIHEPLGQKIENLIKLIYGDVSCYLDDVVSESSLQQEAKHCTAVEQLESFYVSKRTIQNGNIGKQAMVIEIQIPQDVKTKPDVIFIPYLEATTDEFGEVINKFQSAFNSRIVPYLDIKRKKTEKSIIDEGTPKNIPRYSQRYFTGYEALAALQTSVDNEVELYAK